MPAVAKDPFKSLRLSPEPVADELQQGSVRGKVTDQKGEPVIGATVLIKGTSIGASTDMSGNYSIARVPANSTLVFSYIGMTSQEIAYAGQATLNVVMKEAVTELEDVVVIGYGVVKKLISPVLSVLLR